MRTRLLGLIPVLAAIRLVTTLEQDSFSQDESQEAKNSHQHHQEQGSWAHWWSYDGISGPDYWNINKRWRLCSLGRKQSPINIRTERLVYDHLLGPIHLNWSSSSTDKHKQKSASNWIRMRLLNSGRGIEAWLPEPSSSSQLILSRGPLSYDYGLFKIELHSAAPTTVSASNQQASPSKGRPDAQDVSTNELEPDEDELEMAADYLRSGKSSEHLIDGRPFEAELQLHFYNKHLATSASEAQHLAGQEEGGRPSLFAAISVFLVAGPDVSNKSALDELMLNNLGSLVNQGDSLELTIDRGQLDKLIPEQRHYITYQGSMNRPPCSESVDWIILNRPIRMDLDRFRSLFEKLNSNQENIRPVKPLNRRILRTTINNLHQARNHFREVNNFRHSSQKFPTNDLDSTTNGLGNDFISTSKARRNCTPSIGADGREELNQCQKEAQGGRKGHGDKEDQSSGGPMSCSMKPRYVYQLTYATTTTSNRKWRR